MTLGRATRRSRPRWCCATMLAEAPAGETIEINWLTSAQQWAIREVVAAGIELQPYGPVMVRGMDGPPLPVHPERRVRLSPPQSGPRSSCRQPRVARSTASWTVASTPSGVVADRGRASFATTVHGASSRRAMSSAV